MTLIYSFIRVGRFSFRGCSEEPAAAVLVSSPNFFRAFFLKGLKTNADNYDVSYGGISAQLRNKITIQQTRKDLED